MSASIVGHGSKADKKAAVVSKTLRKIADSEKKLSETEGTFPFVCLPQVCFAVIFFSRYSIFLQPKYYIYETKFLLLMSS
jgi:hypothetical protein